MLACSKKSYPTATAAALALRAIHLHPSPGRRECALYRCAHRHRFHLTSDRGSVGNRWMKAMRPRLLVAAQSITAQAMTCPPGTP